MQKSFPRVQNVCARVGQFFKPCLTYFKGFHDFQQGYKFETLLHQYHSMGGPRANIMQVQSLAISQMQYQEK